MRSSHAFTLALILIGAGYASREPQTAVAQPSERPPLDPAADNRAVVDELTPGLVMQLEIDRDTVRLGEAEILLVPRQAQTEGAGERVVVSGLREGQTVATVSIPDQRVNVQEGVGIVIREQRTLNVALPLPRRVDTLEVTLPDQTQPQRLEVRPVFEQFCAEQPRAPICR